MRKLGHARWALAVIPCLAISFAISAGIEAPEPDMNPAQCEKWPYGVYCYEYAGHKSFACFYTFCDAVKAGWSHCTRNFQRRTCK